MDASDIMKRNRNKYVLVNKVSTLVVTNPGGDCSGLLTTCCTITASCNTSYGDFEERQEVKDGRKAYVCPTAN